MQQLLSRLREKTIPEPMSGCWLWIGATNSSGYGNLSVNGRVQLAHRVAWAIENGPISPGICICHHCDNPACVNPLHLFPADIRSNMHDMIQKGRDSASVTGRFRQATHCIREHPFDSSNTGVRKTGGRYCKACHRAHYLSRKDK